jgi:hypothetical protein
LFWFLKCQISTHKFFKEKIENFIEEIWHFKNQDGPRSKTTMSKKLQQSKNKNWGHMILVFKNQKTSQQNYNHLGSSYLGNRELDQKKKGGNHRWRRTWGRGRFFASSRWRRQGFF